MLNIEKTIKLMRRESSFFFSIEQNKKKGTSSVHIEKKARETSEYTLVTIIIIISDRTCPFSIYF
jgi:hypothetical protein